MIKFGNDYGVTKGRYVLTDGGSEFYLVPTICCAVAVLKGVNNYTATETLKGVIELVKSDSKNDGPGYGQTNLLVFSKPSEIQLEKNLKSAGFTMVCDTITRRKCYEAESMKMWIYSF
jgi:hypothetical protein